jgi:hypothetical protein
MKTIEVAGIGPVKIEVTGAGFQAEESALELELCVNLTTPVLTVRAHYISGDGFRTDSDTPPAYTELDLECGGTLLDVLGAERFPDDEDQTVKQNAGVEAVQAHVRGLYYEAADQLAVIADTWLNRWAEEMRAA